MPSPTSESIYFMSIPLGCIIEFYNNPDFYRFNTLMSRQGKKSSAPLNPLNGSGYSGLQYLFLQN